MGLKVLEAVISEGDVVRNTIYIAGSDLMGLLKFAPQGDLGSGQNRAAPIAGMKDLPGWKKAVNSLSGPPEQWIRFGEVEVKKTKDSYYMNAEGIQSAGVEERGGPSYNELTGLLGELQMSDADIAKGVRKLLNGDCTGAPKALACLTAAMFLAEPRRNHRSFPLNLMLLDFVENNVRYGSAGDKAFSWNTILWRTGFGDDRAAKSKTYQFKPGGPGGAAQNSTLVVHQRGGKLPMSHTEAVKQSELALPAHPPANTAVYLPNAEMDKECTIVVRWLANILNKASSSFTLTVNKTGAGDSLVERLRTATTVQVTYTVKFTGRQAVPTAQFSYLNLTTPPPRGSFAEAISQKVHGALGFRCSKLVMCAQ